MTSVILGQCSNQLSYQANWELVICEFAVNPYCNDGAETNGISHIQSHLKWERLEWSYNIIIIINVLLHYCNCQSGNKHGWWALLVFVISNISKFQFDLDVKCLHMSPWLGRLGDYSLHYNVKIWITTFLPICHRSSVTSVCWVLSWSDSLCCIEKFLIGWKLSTPKHTAPKLNFKKIPVGSINPWNKVPCFFPVWKIPVYS